MKKLRVITEFPNATQSPDFKNPIGAKQDNHSSKEYLEELNRLVDNKPFAYMDLGCAGGQAVIDVHNSGNISCGIEGSNLNVMLNNSKHGVADNWKKYKDVCLFKADITKVFMVLDDTNQIQRFDVITAWDVLEHPKPEEIPYVIDNIVCHLEDDGVFIALVNTVHGTHHQCVKPKEWWLNIFKEK